MRPGGETTRGVIAMSARSKTILFNAGCFLAGVLSYRLLSAWLSH
jgi:hypothetical protein